MDRDGVCPFVRRHACFAGLCFRECVESNVTLVNNTGKEELFYNDSRALLIGQSKFKPGWNELTTVPSDLVKLEDTLRNQHGFSKVEIESDMRGAEILPRILQFLNENTGMNMRLVIYVSGHGIEAFGACEAGSSENDP